MDSTTVRFSCDTAHFEIRYPDALLSMTLANKKKLFKLMLFDPANNAAAITVTVSAIDQLIVESKEAWREASIDYQHGFVDADFHRDWPAKKRAQARANNKRMMERVKREKATHERMLKLKAAFEEIADKTGGLPYV